MQLLIDIDDTTYQFLKDFKTYRKIEHYKNNAYEAITAGTPFEWNDVTKGEWPKPEDENRQFLVIDSNGEVSVQAFHLTIDEPEKQIPYFSGMKNVVAWCPLPLKA